MSHAYQPRSSRYAYQSNLSQGTTTFHRPLPRQQVHRATPVRRLPSLSGASPGRFLPDEPDLTKHHENLSHKSGFVIRQDEFEAIDFRDEESNESLTSHSDSKLESKPHSASYWSRCVVHLHRFSTKYIVDWWLIEILSWCFSAASMAIIFGVLFFYDNRMLPVWPLGVTINGLISLLSTCAKSALILPTAEGLGQLKWSHFNKDSRSMMDFERIDVASRGPWGALLLFGKARPASVCNVPGNSIPAYMANQYPPFSRSCYNRVCRPVEFLFPTNRYLPQPLGCSW
jgi:hypothetical protein